MRREGRGDGGNHYANEGAIMFAVAQWPELSGGNCGVTVSLSQLESSEEEEEEVRSRLKMIKER